MKSGKLNGKSAVVLYCIILFSGVIRAQSLVNYLSVRNTGVSYASISGVGTSFASWRNGSALTQDDNRSALTDIGFDFWYNGTRYTQFCVSTNGFIDFSSSASTGAATVTAFGNNNATFSNASGGNSTSPVIAPFYDNLMTAGGTAPLGTSILYYLSGTAPSRTLIVEWINMTANGNTSPVLNFQVSLVETTGQIIIHYGGMNAGTNTFSYSMGLNSGTISATPTAPQLKTLQNVNTNNFGNTVQNNLSTMPSANSQYIFSPPAPTSTAGTLTFSGITQTGMTLNWLNWASNEVGYVIYNSEDDTTYNFVAQTASNIATRAITGLFTGTVYFWKVYAVTDGYLSAALSASAATLPAGTKVSVSSGNWNVNARWSPAGIPTAVDNVTIAPGHSVTIASNSSCNNLTVGNGAASATLSIGNNNAARTFSVNGDILINNLGNFGARAGSNTTHSLFMKGDITNNGSLDLAPDVNSFCNSFFSQNKDQNISGSGALTRFNLMNVNLGGSETNFLNITTSEFSATNNFLTLTSGTFKLATVNSVNIVPFAATATISANAGIWLSAGNASVTLAGGINLAGLLTVSAGTLTMGDIANEDCLLSGCTYSSTGGVTNVAGKFYTNTINVSNVIISGGTLNVGTVGSTNTGNAPFQISSTGSKFDMSGGAITVVREGGTGIQHLGFINTGATFGTISGGTLQIGSAATPAAQIININSISALGNLVLNSANATASLVTNPLSILGDVTINSGALSAGALAMTVGGNWSNNGGVFSPGTGTVIFSSSTPQTIFKAGGETFNTLNFIGNGPKTLSSPISASGNFSISFGSNFDVSASNFSLAIGGNLINSGAFNSRSGLILLNGGSAQTIGGSSTTDFYDLTLNNTGGASLTHAENLIGTLSLNGGTFNANSQVFTMVSTATATARIAALSGTGDILGNVTVQRFVPGGATGWVLLGTPISSPLTLNDWDDNIIISCSTCPDGYAANFPSIYTYNETVAGLYDAASSYVPLNNINDAIIAGKGYWVYLGTNQFTTTNQTIDVTGTVRKNNYSIPLNYTNFGSPANDGWNLIHNPYPSPIRWSLLKGSTANIDDAIYTYNSDLNGGTGAYASYVNGISSPAIGAGGIDDLIPMCQGFYVHSTGATALVAQESNKVGGNPTFLKSGTSSTRSELRINLAGAGTFSDEVVLYTEAGAGNGFDIGFDAYKVRGQDPLAPIIVLEDGLDQFQVNGIAPVSGNYTTTLKTLTGYTGSYTISADNISSFPRGACISLYDRFTSSTTDLRTSTYTFNLIDTTTVSRFVLSITLNSLTVSSTVIQPTCKLVNGGEIRAKGINSGPWNYFWKVNGSLVKSSLNKNTADTLAKIGGSTVDLEITTSGSCDNFNKSYVINSLVPITASFNSADTFFLHQSTPLYFSNTSTNAGSSVWNFGVSGGYSYLTSPSYSYTIPGKYKVSLLCSSSTGCSDSASKFITVIDNPVGIESRVGLQDHLTVMTLAENEYLLDQKFETPCEVTFELYDSLGRLMKNFGTQETDHLSLKLDLSTFSPGMYVLRITVPSEQHSLKFMVR
ncbi:MAG: T9SS type A sorting domain-containing protein [bacterium]|nr:T9SS type A sorting domain-containing protein [bacterium]